MTKTSSGVVPVFEEINMQIRCGFGVRILWIAILLSFILLAIHPALAQTFRGTIIGTVTDPSGAAIVGANVEINNVDTGLDRTTQTTIDGSYVMPELPVGNYRVIVSKSGFQTSVTDGIRVDVAQQTTVNATLKPGSVEQKVVVSGATQPQIETASNTLGGIMDQQQVTSIPANGRDYQKLIYLTPGVAGSPDEISDSPGSYGVFSVNGARGRSNNFLLDGTDMNDGFRNDPAINEAGVFGDPATILPLDAISELHVLSNYEAEYGRNAGGVIEIVTKSGTNQFHGTGLEYFRNTVLNARNYFNDVGTPQAPFHNNQFGGSLGGPIVKDKTFFFFDYEGQRESGAQNAQECVPTPAELATATNPVIIALLARNPFPAVSNSATSCPNLTASTPFSNSVDSLIGKIDHSFNPNNLLSGRYYYGNSTQLFPLSLTGGGTLPGFNTYTPTRVQLVSISDVWTISPTRTNEARLGWNRFAEGFFPQDRSFDPSSIGLDTGSPSGGLPVIDISSCSLATAPMALPACTQIGANNSTPRHRVDANWHFIDNVEWKIGRHDLKFGYEFRRTSITQNLGINARGLLDFANLSDFLAGKVTDGGSITTGNGVRHSYQNNDGLYIQDAYKLRPTVTLNAGLRWDYYGVFHEKNDLLSNFYPTQGLVQVGTQGFGKLYQPDYRNFAPRLSIAWDVRGKGKTVVRAGWGIFYDAFSQDIFLDHLPFPVSYGPGAAYNGIGPAAMESGLPVATLASGTPVFGGFAPVTTAFGVDPNIRTPYMENYNLNIQQQISRKIVLQIGYVGSQGHRLFHFLDLNQPNQSTIDAYDLTYASAHNDVFGNACLPNGGEGCIPPYSYGVPATPRNFPQYPYLYIFQEQASAKSNYNSLQGSIRVNDYRGFSSQINYVWSHSIDDASDSEDFVPNASQPNDSTNPNAEKGNSSFDVRNRFSWNFAYKFPQRGGKLSRLRDGWGVDGAAILQTGQPFGLNYNFEGDFDGSGEGDGRPDVVGPLLYQPSNPSQFLALSSFIVPCTPSPVYTGPSGSNPAPANEQICVPGTRHFGDEGRNSLHGPGFKEMDFAIFKDTPITERLTAQFRCEIFNLFNHPNFANPLLPAAIADAAAGGIDTTPSDALYGHSSGFLHLNTTGDVGIGNPFLGGGAPRGIQFAVKFMF
jgi:outer membrane receptor protein involved in Fe transport